MSGTSYLSYLKYIHIELERIADSLEKLAKNDLADSIDKALDKQRIKKNMANL